LNSSRIVIEGCTIAAVDLARNEYASGYLVVGGDRIAAVGAGPAPGEHPVAGLVRAGAPVGLGWTAQPRTRRASSGWRCARSSATRPAGGRSSGAHHQGGVGARDHSRRPLPGAGGRDRLPRAREAGRRPLWRVDDLAYAGIDDPVAALVFGSAPRVELLLVNGQALVEGGELKTADIERVAGELDTASKSLVRKSQEPIADSS
jgi:hypothetical protein